MPLLAGSGGLGRDGVFSESTVLKSPGNAGCMIRTGRWKYCLYLDGQAELYDLAEDPGEVSNLAGRAEHAELERQLRERVEDFWEPEEQMRRFERTPQAEREKHFYEFSNQFILGDGTVTDARP
jgi:choline-sulfatase